MSDVEVTIVPKEETISSHVQPGKKFIYGSLNQASYLQDFSDAIATSVGKEISHVISESKISEEEENTNVNDNDWYII
jgi:hypothetical protein